jgi:hypothetical protein
MARKRQLDTIMMQFLKFDEPSEFQDDGFRNSLDCFQEELEQFNAGSLNQSTLERLHDRQS